MLTVIDADASRHETWDRLVAASSSGSFLQSWQWGAFQEVAGFPIRRLLFIDTLFPETIRAVCLLVAHPLPLGASSLYAPWGPVIAEHSEEQHQTSARLREVLTALQGVVKNVPEPPVYLRVEPKLRAHPAISAALADTGFSFLGRGVQPQQTLVINLLQNEDDLLRGMHQKTRYNIRIAVRHGVTVEEHTNQQGLTIFLQLAVDVEKRGRFRYHPQSYYEAMVRTLDRGMLRIFVATHHGVPLAAGIFLRFGTTLTYAHGASSLGRSHVMAPTLLHWEAMLRAKASGATLYDFFGIASSRSSQHSWEGITRFKRGFGGLEETYLGIADTIVDPVRYRLYTIARGMRDLIHH